MTATVTYIRFVLNLIEPGGVTMPRPTQRGEVDVVPDTDAHGVPHIPGTSLAGALRAWVAARTRDEALVQAWFGHLLEVGTGGGDVDAVASRIWVLGSRLVDDHGADLTEASQTERWSTAIDRHRGAARVNTLRGERLVASGSRFEVFLRWDDADPAQLDRLLSLISDWRPSIGRGTARGRGRCEVQNLRYGTVKLQRPDDMLRWLTLSGPELARAAATHQPAPQTDRANGVDAGTGGRVIELPFTVVGPFHIGQGGEGRFSVDPATDRKVAALLQDDGSVIIPGTTLKGVIRSRAEYILRSVGVTPEPCESPTCGRCWPCLVFGHGGGTDATATSIGLRSRVRFGDCVLADVHTRRRTHVAIDRFTGGARDQQLYTVEAVETGRGTLTIELNVDTAATDNQARALIRLVLADVNDGLVGIGRSTARGYGSVSVDTSAAERNGDLPQLPDARQVLESMTSGNRV